MNIANTQLIVIKGGDAYDMSGLVSSVRWSGRRGSSARELSVTFLDDDGYGRDRAGLDVEQGHRCVFYAGGKELFRGMFAYQEQSSAKTLVARAYDLGISLANNVDSFNYADKTASEIFKDCCARFGLPVGEVADTRHRIPQLPKPKTSAWDVIADALSLTLEATGVRFYPLSRGGVINLIERRENVLQWVIETGVNLESYTRSSSIERVKTRVKLLSKDGALLASAVDEELERRIGIFGDVVSRTSEMNDGQLGDIAKGALAENKHAARSLTVSALGLPDVITGMGVYVVIDHLGVAQAFYVEEDEHVFRGQTHNMTLKLCVAGDVGG